MDYVEVPHDILENIAMLLCVVIYFLVQGYPFLTTISRNIKFNINETLKDMSVNNFLAALDCAFNLYKKGGLKITHMLMHMQFGFLEDDLHSYGITLNLASAKEHVGEIEQFIRTLKVCVCASDRCL